MTDFRSIQENDCFSKLCFIFFFCFESSFIEIRTWSREMFQKTTREAMLSLRSVIFTRLHVYARQPFFLSVLFFFLSKSAIKNKIQTRRIRIISIFILFFFFSSCIHCFLFGLMQQTRAINYRHLF